LLPKARFLLLAPLVLLGPSAEPAVHNQLAKLAGLSSLSYGKWVIYIEFT
jgi:hypothetical protein